MTRPLLGRVWVEPVRSGRRHQTLKKKALLGKRKGQELLDWGRRRGARGAGWDLKGKSGGHDEINDDYKDT
jgi:hypothetical protein